MTSHRTGALFPFSATIKRGRFNGQVSLCLPRRPAPCSLLPAQRLRLLLTPHRLLSSPLPPFLSILRLARRRWTPHSPYPVPTSGPNLRFPFGLFRWSFFISIVYTLATYSLRTFLNNRQLPTLLQGERGVGSQVADFIFSILAEEPRSMSQNEGPLHEHLSVSYSDFQVCFWWKGDVLSDAERGGCGQKSLIAYCGVREDIEAIFAGWTFASHPLSTTSSNTGLIRLPCGVTLAATESVHSVSTLSSSYTLYILNVAHLSQIKLRLFCWGGRNRHALSNMRVFILSLSSRFFTTERCRLRFRNGTQISWHLICNFDGNLLPVSARGVGHVGPPSSSGPCSPECRFPAPLFLPSLFQKNFSASPRPSRFRQNLFRRRPSTRTGPASFVLCFKLLTSACSKDVVDLRSRLLVDYLNLLLTLTASRHCIPYPLLSFFFKVPWRSSFPL